jgi:CRISPR-associated protein Cas2
MTRWIVAYDIPDDRRRQKLANMLENFGDRVQYSVFEVMTDDEEVSVLVKKIDAIIAPGDDSVRLYPLCGACAGKVIVLGVGQEEPWHDPEIYIV